MCRTDRRHSVAGSPSKVPQRNSTKKTNARAVFAFRLKKILGFGREDAPLPLPKLRPGGGGLSPIVTRKHMTRSESLPAMRLSFSSCSGGHSGAEAAGDGVEGEKPSEFEDFHADLCARIAHLAPGGATEETEATLAVDEKYFAREDAGDDEAATKTSIPVTSPPGEERESDETECVLRFSSVDISEDEDKAEDGQEEIEFVSVPRPATPKAESTMEKLVAQRVLVGEVSYSPIHTSAYGMNEGEDGSSGDKLSFDLMLHHDAEAPDDDGYSATPQQDAETRRSSEGEESAISSSDLVDVTACNSGSEDSSVSPLALSNSTSGVLIASFEGEQGGEIEGWESAGIRTGNDSLTGDETSTCSTPGPATTTLSLVETVPSSSSVGCIESHHEEVEIGVVSVHGHVNLSLGFLDFVLEGVCAQNRNTRRTSQVPGVGDSTRPNQRPRLEDSSRANESAKANVESASTASKPLVSTFASVDGEAFTELPSTSDVGFYTTEGVMSDEKADDSEHTESSQSHTRGFVHVTRPFRFDDVLHEDGGHASSARDSADESNTGDLKAVASPQSFSDDELKSEEDDLPAKARHLEEITTEKNPASAKATRRGLATSAAWLSVILSIAVAFGVFKMMSRLPLHHELSNTDCRKILRDFGWIKNHRMDNIDASLSARDGATWNASDILTAPCEVVLATQTLEEIAAYEHKMHQAYKEMEAESCTSRDAGALKATGVEGKLILCLAFTLLAWALLQYDSLS